MACRWLELMTEIQLFIHDLHSNQQMKAADTMWPQASNQAQRMKRMGTWLWFLQRHLASQVHCCWCKPVRKHHTMLSWSRLFKSYKNYFRVAGTHTHSLNFLKISLNDVQLAPNLGGQDKGEKKGFKLVTMTSFHDVPTDLHSTMSCTLLSSHRIRYSFYD